MSDKFIIALLLSFGITFVSIVGYHNLPHWCENPQGDGNWIVQPLCK